MSTSKTLLLNGSEVDFQDGETVLEVAQRAGEEIMTLCHDPRLKPVGACRTCLVEIKGWRRLTASCATKAEAGMEVTCKNERIERHQKALLSLYLSDNVSEEATHDSADASELHRLAAEAGAATDWPRMEAQRFERLNDRNPYVQFRADRCILCARCTRYCEEVESVSAISLAGRGAATTIATADSRSLLDTSCELCGGCIAVCPTGAMTEKKPLLAQLRPARELEKVRTTCNYCGVGCQMDLNVDRSANEGRGVVAKITSPDAGVSPNDGNLCVKGRFAYQFIDHPDRLTTPLIRDAAGELQEASWEEALRVAAAGLQGVAKRHGADSLGFISSSRCTGEENYLVQKLSRAVFKTNNVHQCSAT
jgi:predicted molibdopterin-dependent oxidoreductase YjgC